MTKDQPFQPATEVEGSCHDAVNPTVDRGEGIGLQVMVADCPAEDKEHQGEQEKTKKFGEHGTFKVKLN